MQQLPTGTILVEQSRPQDTGAALYARVSSADQKADLERQLARLVQFATESGYTVKEAVSEIGSGLNGKRPRLLRLLANPRISAIVVEHRDRLARFGAEYIGAALRASGRNGQESSW